MSQYPHLHRTLWIDALCINQDDIVERGHQVRLMREIYSKAQKVSVWLGDEKHMQDTFIELRKHQGPWDQGANRIFSAVWVERIWVIQEVALVQKVVFVAGEENIK
ncbi:HET-domain-containing protein [Polyplosphaeria fusca]|uniref:HET-domain-containing protein n=1 Tax=Polyplosphaeria fusca TaxID=682080 RepID=A0A9P4UZJ3_9PLEO|nr:HET-domain-containing protein [Polyplosphaeria fusca]